MKLQIKAVASPRNHLYRTDQSLVEVGLFGVSPKTKLDHFRNLADNLNLQPAFRKKSLC